MARRVFFSFHYQLDIGRANVVRNHNVVQRQYEGTSRYHDKSLWEEAQRNGDVAIKRLINDGLSGSSVTCVLIGSETWQRRWVRYELLKSFERGNGLLGITLHNIRETGIGRPGVLSRPATTLLTAGLRIPTAEPNPFDFLGYRIDQQRERVELLEFSGSVWRSNSDLGEMALSDLAYDLGPRSQAGKLSQHFAVYDWISDNGYEKFAVWVEQAASKMRKLRWI